VITLLMFSFIEPYQGPIPLHLIPFIIMVINEVMIGLIIGFTAGIIFIGIQFAGQLIGLDMGFGIVNVIDPQSGENVSIIGQFKYLLAILLFMCLDGHLFLIRALKLSYEAIPVSRNVLLDTDVVSKLISMSSNIFVIAIKIGSAALAALFITSFVMGVIARMVPQMNIFIVGFPLKISVGFIMIILTLPFFMYMFGKLYNLFERDIVEIIQLM